MSVTDGPGLDRAGEPAPLPIVWRVSDTGLVLGRIGVTVGTLALLGATTRALAWPGADQLATGLIAVFSLGMALMSWRAALHPSVAATEAGVVVRNPLSTVTVPWADVVGATAGFDGVTITRSGAPPTTTWAVQKSNLSTWRGAQTRADVVAATIQALATARGAGTGATASESAPIARLEGTPMDAARRPLRFPWRMSPLEAAVVDFLRHSTSPLLSAATAVLFGALGLVLVGLVADEKWDAHLLQERGVVVHGTVVGVPGMVGITWPGIAPESMFLDGGAHADQEYSTGEVVDVLSDPRHPARARLVGAEPDVAEDAWTLVVGLGSLLLAGAYAKWSRWLAVADHEAPPTAPGRHRAAGRH